jgi:hypothetical protein
MSGPQLASRVAGLLPGIRGLYLSGYSDAAIGEPSGLGISAALLPKPFTASALTQKVRDALDGPALTIT